MRAILVKWLAWVSGTGVLRGMAPLAVTQALATVEPLNGTCTERKNAAAEGQFELDRRLDSSLVTASG